MLTKPKDKLVKSIAAANFETLFDQNLPKLERETGLMRKDII